MVNPGVIATFPGLSPVYFIPLVIPPVLRVDGLFLHGGKRPRSIERLIVNV